MTADPFTILTTLDPDNLRVDTNKGRTYLREGRTYPSVTRIIDNLPKPALFNWGKKLTAEFALNNLDNITTRLQTGTPFNEVRKWVSDEPSRQRDTAGALGSDLHAWASQHELTGTDEPPDDEPLLSLTRQYLELRAAHPEWRLWASEAVVLNEAYPYGGTMDGIVRLGDGSLAVFDIKTGRGVWPEAALQLWAYANADYLALASGESVPMPSVLSGLVFHVRPDAWKIHRVDLVEHGAELEALWQGLYRVDRNKGLDVLEVVT